MTVFEIEKNIIRQLDELASNVCDNFCKYRETCDDNHECDYIRNGGNCPIDIIV